MAFDKDIQVTILLAALAARTEFGVPLIAGRSMTFADVTRTYANADAAEGDAELGATLTAMVVAMFAQNISVSSIMVGKMPAAVLDDWNLAVTVGTDGDVFSVTVLGQTYTYTQVALDTATEIVNGLIAAITAGGLPLDLVPNGADFDMGPSSPVYTGLVLAPTASSGGTGAVAVVNTTPGTGAYAGLDAIQADDNGFYGVLLESRAGGDIWAASQWVDDTGAPGSVGKVGISQTSEAAVITTVDTDIMSWMETLGYDRTLLIYHPTDTDFVAEGWTSNRLGVDLDIDETIWKFVELVGPTPYEPNATVQGIVEGKNGNLYSTLKGAGATGPGLTSGGQWMDLVLTGDWLQARLEEDYSARLVKATADRSKIPYDNKGIGIFGQLTSTRISGAPEGRFVPGSLVLDLPDIEDISAAVKTSRVLTFSFEVEPGGAIQGVVVNGTVAIAV